VFLEEGVFLAKMIKSVKITDNLLLEEDFILVTYTTGFD
jgi:protein involved in ribonucleotide reduction